MMASEKMRRLLHDEDVRIGIALFSIALVLYIPGIWWGLPHATAADRAFVWGSDELAPTSSVGELYRVLLDPHPTFNIQYPLFHYMVQAIFVAPYLVWLKLSGGLGHPAGSFPFGLSDPVRSLAVLSVLHRLPSTLMAAGVVVIAFVTARLLWDRRTAVIAGALVLVMYPMFYYSRTSNVDMPALFWTALGFAIAAACLRDGLTRRRALQFGVVAALASATKDASAFALLGIAVPVVVTHAVRQHRAGASRLDTWKPLALGLAVSAVVYVFASGLVLNVPRYMLHVRYISKSTAVYVYPASLVGDLRLLRESAGHIVAALGLPAAVFALIGVALSVRWSPRALAFLLPCIAVFAVTILPVHFVNFRYVLIIAYVLMLFAAFGVRSLAADQSGRWRPAIAPLLLLLTVGWSLTRGLDLTNQMIRDSRYRLGEWFQSHARPGDRIGYFGAPKKLPQLSSALIAVQLEDFCTRAAWTSAQAPEFVIVSPQQHFEMVHEWSVPEQVYRALEDGSLGYQRVLRVQTRSLFSTRPVPFVNPPVQVFVRNDRLSQIPTADRDTVPQRPIFAGLEHRLGLGAHAPAGLVWSQIHARPCELKVSATPAPASPSPSPRPSA
jgi:4-amino-4-deoxy-L-arabinose transferase-like glycosyltransferase